MGVVYSFIANRIQLVLFSYLQNRIEEKTEFSTYEVIGDNEKLISEGKELSIEEAVEEISIKIKLATDLISKKLN